MSFSAGSGGSAAPFALRGRVGESAGIREVVLARQGVMRMAVGQKRRTYGEFEPFIAAPENHDRRFELINGEIVEVSPTEEHATLAARISGEIYAYLKQHPIGRVGVEPRHKMPEDNHHALLPDVAFTSHERAFPIVKRGVVPQLPDLAVEIKSPDDSYRVSATRPPTILRTTHAWSGSFILEDNSLKSIRPLWTSMSL